MDNPKTGTDLLMLDFQLAMERVGGDEDLLKEIARLFLDEYPDSLRKLEVAIASQNPKQVEHEAHTLKGAIANFGAPQATNAALELEQMGRNNDLSQAVPSFQRLKNALSGLDSELQTLANQ